MSKCLKFLKSILLLFVFLSGMSLFAIENNDKNVTFNSKGYVQIDHIFWKGDKNDDFLSGAFLKNVGLFVDGEYDNSFSYFLHFNFRLKYNLSQAYIRYSGDFWNIKIGKVVIPFSLEEAVNSNHRVFMERCLLEGIVENSFLGFIVDFSTDFYNLSVAVVVPELVYSSEKKQSNKYSFLVRGFTNPIKHTGFMCHLGFNYKLIKMHPEENSPLGSVMFKDISSFDAPHSLLVSQLSSLPRYYVLGFEFLGIWKSLCVQSEFTFINALWRDYENEVYNSWYIQTSFLLTGESRIYDFNSGIYFDPVPKLSFGAFELAFRYSHSNMMNNGALLRGVSARDGKKDTFVCGVNWFVNKSLKLQFNYAYEEFTYRLLNSRALSGVGFRIQFSF